MIRMLGVAALAGCGPSPVAVCAGNHAGQFTGADFGPLQATLNERGRAEVTMTGAASGTLSSSGKVKSDGTIAADGFIELEGLLDLDTCDSEGSWTTAIGLGGTWSMRLQ